MGLFSVAIECAEPLITSIVIMIVPWPVSNPVPVEQMPHYRAALALVDECAKQIRITRSPDRFKAGWAKVELTPPVGTPLAGYFAARVGQCERAGGMPLL